MDKAFAKLGEKVDKAERLVKGTDNKVFLVTCGDRKYIYREYTRKFKKDNFVNNLLSKNGIPVAKILANGMGWEIEEYISGEDAEDSLKNGSLGLDVYFRKTAEILKKIHSIKMDKFGFLGVKKLRYLDRIQLLETRLSWAKSNTDRMGTENVELIDRAIGVIQNKMAAEFSKDGPVLCHGDVSPTNMRWNGNDLIFIDWGDAAADVWEWDLTVMLYWDKYRAKSGPEAMERRELFYKYYDIGDRKKFERRNKLLELLHTTGLLHWYWRYDENRPAFLETKHNVLELLNTNYS